MESPGAPSFPRTVFREALRIGDSVPSLVSGRRPSCGSSCYGGGGFAMYPVVEDEERQPEDGEGMLGPQFAVLDVDVEPFGEAVDRQHRELLGGWVDVGEVVARLVQVAAAGQDQATAG